MKCCNCVGNQKLQARWRAEPRRTQRFFVLAIIWVWRGGDFCIFE